MQRYCCPTYHTSASMFHSWNQEFRIIGLLGHSPNIKLAGCWEQNEGWLIWLHYVFPFNWRSGFMIVTSSFSPFGIVFGNHRFSNSVLQWMLEFWSSHQTIFVERGSSRWILSSAVTSAAVVLWFLDIILFNVWQSLSIPLSWCLPMICVCCYNHGKWCSGYT